MGILRICDDVPGFADGTALSPTTLELMGEVLRALDEGTRLGGVLFTGMYGQHPTENDEQFQVVWRGGGIFRTGMTTLRLTTFTSGTVVTGDTLRVYRGDTAADGSLSATFSDFTIAAGLQTHNVTLSGYTDQEAIRAIAEVRHAANPPAPYTGVRTWVVLAELLPVSIPDAAPTLPSFAANADVTATKLTQLSDYVDWLVRRVSVRYDPLFIIQFRRIGPFCIPVAGTDPNVVWRGGFRRTTFHTSMVIKGLTMRVWSGATETIKLIVNGTTLQTYNVPTALGESSWSFTQSLAAYAVDSVVRVEVQYERSAPALNNQPVNRWTVNEAYLDTPSGGATTLASWSVRQAAVTDSSIVAWLQAARTLASTIATRITDNNGLWAYQRLYTVRPGFDPYQVQVFEAWSIPAVMRRAGEALVGRGRALSLGYSAGYVDEAEYERQAKGDDGIGAYPVKNTRTQGVVEADNVESFVYYLDNAPGLPIGAPYNVRGVESWVLMERLKVVE